MTSIDSTSPALPIAQLMADKMTQRTKTEAENTQGRQTMKEEKIS